MKKKIIIGSAIIVVFIGIIFANMTKSSGGSLLGLFGSTVNVSVKEITKENISSIVSANGVVEIEENKKQEVSFSEPIMVKKVFVKSNTAVQKGQQLVEFDLENLYSQIESLKVEKNIQELAVQKAKLNNDNSAVEGLEIELSIAENNLAVAKRTYEDAKKDYEGRKELYNIGAISKAEFNEVERNLKDLKSSSDNAKLNLDRAKYNLNKAIKDNNKQSESKINIETEQLRLTGIDLKIKALEDKIKEIQNKSVSPVNGIVSEVNVLEGSYTSGQPAFVIVDNSNLQVRAEIKELDISKISIGQSVSITGDAISNSEDVTGTIKSISQIAKKNKTATGEEILIDVIISVDKGFKMLKPGLNAVCDITTSKKENALIASFEMIVENKDGSKSVFIVDDKNIIREKKIKTGIISGLKLEVLDGLKEGEKVVIDPQPNLKDGAKANISEGYAK